VAPNDGYKHAWSTSLCYDTLNNRGISRVDLDNTDAMCKSKGGTVVTTGKCIALGWQYLNRKADGTLPVTGTGIGTTQGPANPADGLGFCYTSVNLTAVGADGTFASSATCPSRHNSFSLTPAEWPACLSTPDGCQTQASYDAGLGWSFTSSQCRYAYGIIGKTTGTITRADGTTIATGTVVDLSTAAFDTMGECLGQGLSWDNWLPVTGTSVKTSASGGDHAGMPAGTAIRKLDALANVEDGGGAFYSGTGAVCQKCHSDQSRSYQERDKPGFPLTRHKLAGDAVGKPSSRTSPWRVRLGAPGCAMLHVPQHEQAGAGRSHPGPARGIQRERVLHRRRQSLFLLHGCRNGNVHRARSGVAQERDGTQQHRVRHAPHRHLRHVPRHGRDPSDGESGERDPRRRR
jgi:hypothetical protein